MVDPSPAPAPADGALAAALDLVGDRWSLQVVAALLAGAERFNEVAEAVPRVAPNVLSARLRTLEAAGLLVVRPYSERPPRLRYQLTARGRSLADVIDALVGWESNAGWPEAVHEVCGTPLQLHRVCPRWGVVVDDDRSSGLDVVDEETIEI